MRRIAGSCRFVDHKAMALQKARYGQGEKTRDEHPGARDGNLAREGRGMLGRPVDRTDKGGRKQDPTEAPQGWLHATPKCRRNLRPSGRGGCQRRRGSARRGAEGLVIAHDPHTDVAGTGVDALNRALVAGGGTGGEDEDVVAAEMDEELAREEAVDAAALFALSAGGE